ncbi:MAG: archease [Synergistetes bacterium]|nr:archease [Synergistota bacterium]MCX8128216.1 archease [Synergistota bacterium]MDW8192663.1 archease [Synergistota bacterium]
MIEFIEHTADVGIKVRSESLEGLFKEAAFGLLNIMFSFKRNNFPLEEEFLIELEAGDVEELIVMWLNELIYLFESREYAFRNVEIVELKGSSLKAKIECFKVLKEEVVCYVKAATYYNLSLHRSNDGSYEATIIFDI